MIWFMTTKQWHPFLNNKTFSKMYSSPNLKTYVFSSSNHNEPSFSVFILTDLWKPILIQLICTKIKTSIQFNKNNTSKKHFRQIYCRRYRFYSSLNRLSKFRFMHKYLSATVSRKLNSVKASLLYILPWASFSRKSNTIFFMGKVHVRNKNQSFCKVV